MPNLVPPTTQMNLSVLKRYSPQTTAVVTTASYAVVYTFNATTVSWDRANIEGTLFIVALNNSNPYLSDKRKRNRRGLSNKARENAHSHTGPEEYQLIILSRRGLDNFIIPLTSPDDIETSDKFVILRSSTKCGSVETPSAEEDDAVTYGLWVWGEIDTVAGDRERIERIVRELSERVVKTKAQPSVESVQQRETAAPVPQQHHTYEEENGDISNSEDVNGGGVGAVGGSGGNGVGVGGIGGADIGGVPMTTRSISLTDLFNQQRKEDEGFSRHSHLHSQPNQSQQPSQHAMYPQHPSQHPPQYQPQPAHHPSPHSSHHHYQPPPHQPPPPPGPPPPQHHSQHQYLPQPYESYYQSHQSQQQQPPPHLQHLPSHHQLPHQRHSSSSSQSMPPPPNFLPTPALPAGQPSAYPTPPLPPGSASSRPQSQSQLPPVVNYHLGNYPRMEYNGSGGGVGLAHVNGGNDILARLFQSAAVQSGAGGSSGGGGAGAGGY